MGDTSSWLLFEAMIWAKIYKNPKNWAKNTHPKKFGRKTAPILGSIPNTHMVKMGTLTLTLTLITIPGRPGVPPSAPTSNY